MTPSAPAKSVPGTERGTKECACRDTNTIVQTVAHLPSSAPWRNINCRPTAPIVAPSRRDRSCAFRQYRRVPPRSRRRWGNFPPARPVTGPAADAAAALISKFPVASGRKSCSETEAAPLGAKCCALCRRTECGMHHYGVHAPTNLAHPSRKSPMAARRLLVAAFEANSWARVK